MAGVTVIATHLALSPGKDLGGAPARPHGRAGYTVRPLDVQIPAVTHELASIIDFIRYGASRFSAAGLTFGHSHDNPIDEATHLVLASLHLPPDIPPAYGASKLTAEERLRVLNLIERRINERLPVAYLVGETWFAGMKFRSDRRALVPRS